MKLLNCLLLIQILSSVRVQSNVLGSNDIILKNLPEVNGDKFYYFGYGSNMLTKRIHIQNPTAVKIGAGILEVRKKS